MKLILKLLTPGAVAEFYSAASKTITDLRGIYHGLPAHSSFASTVSSTGFSADGIKRDIKKEKVHVMEIKLTGLSAVMHITTDY